MKVWLDDLRDPAQAHLHYAYFVESEDEEWINSWKDPEVVWVRGSRQCIRLLEKGQVTQIAFDHDLGPYGCGMDVANWIERAASEGRIPRLRWSVHSANPVGRRQMAQALQNADKFWDEQEKRNP